MSHYDNNNPYSTGSATGGGYMSQGSPFGGSQASPGTGRRTGASLGVRPVTIRQINNVQQAHPDADCLIDGSEVGQVTVVGHVVEVHRQATNDSYLLEDGTGRIEVRHWLDDAQRDKERPDDIKELTYVRVTGVLKHFNQKRHVSCQHIRPAGADEIGFHLLECMAVRKHFVVGPVTKGAKAGASSGAGSTSAYVDGGVSAGSDQYAHLQPLEREIIEYINNNSTSADGVHVGAIARAVHAHTNDHHRVGSALDTLLDGGLIYSTIDDTHFAIAA